MGESFTIQFKKRSQSNNLSDRLIADSYSNGGPFDVDLVTADTRIVEAHRYVLSLYSKYLAKQMDDLGFNGKIISECIVFYQWPLEFSAILCV